MLKLTFLSSAVLEILWKSKIVNVWPYSWIWLKCQWPNDPRQFVQNIAFLRSSITQQYKTIATPGGGHAAVRVEKNLPGTFTVIALFLLQLHNQQCLTWKWRSKWWSRAFAIVPFDCKYQNLKKTLQFFLETAFIISEILACKLFYNLGQGRGIHNS